MARFAPAERVRNISGGFTVTRSQSSRSELSNIQGTEAYLPVEVIYRRPAQRSVRFAAAKLAKG